MSTPDADDAESYPRAYSTPDHAPIPAGPCDGCWRAQQCRVYLLACPAFESFVNDGRVARGASRDISRWRYDRIFKGDAAPSAQALNTADGVADSKATTMAPARYAAIRLAAINDNAHGEAPQPVGALHAAITKTGEYRAMIVAPQSARAGWHSTSGGMPGKYLADLAGTSVWLLSWANNPKFDPFIHFNFNL